MFTVALIGLSLWGMGMSIQPKKAWGPEEQWQFELVTSDATFHRLILSRKHTQGTMALCLETYGSIPNFQRSHSSYAWEIGKKPMFFVDHRKMPKFAYYKEGEPNSLAFAKSFSRITVGYNAYLLFGALTFFALSGTFLALIPTLITCLRLKRNLCLQCGYNLTGNTSGVCPECGKKIVIAAIS